MDHERNEHEQWACRIIVRGLMPCSNSFLSASDGRTFACLPLPRSMHWLLICLTLQHPGSSLHVHIFRASVFLFMGASHWTYMYILAPKCIPKISICLACKYLLEYQNVTMRFVISIPLRIICLKF